MKYPKLRLRLALHTGWRPDQHYLPVWRWAGYSRPNATRGTCGPTGAEVDFTKYPDIGGSGGGSAAAVAAERAQFPEAEAGVRGGGRGAGTAASLRRPAWPGVGPGG